MASPFRQELQSIQDEVTEIAVIVSRVQQRLTDVSRRSEEHGDVWQTRLVELESQNKEYLNRTNWLHQQNAQLETKVSQWKPEMDNAIDARNAAFRKLRNTRRVVRDLIDERLQGDEPRGGTHDDGNTEEEIASALREALTPAGGSSNDTDSDRTVRLGIPAPPVETIEPPVAESSRSARRRGKTPASSPPSRSRSGYDSHTEAPSESVMATPTQSPDLSVHSAPEPQGEQEWKIHYSKPPASASLYTGPNSYSKLVRCAIIKEETVGELKSLDLSPEFGLRLLIEGDRMFVYDPIFLEGPGQSSSYVLEWGRARVNQSITELITRGGARPQPVFHTFTFPTTENSDKWHYIGMHSWVVKELDWPIWEGLGRKSRRKLLEKLSERCHGQIDKEDIVKMLDDGELSQFCVEISSTLYKVKSEKFARRIGYNPRPDGRPQRVDSGSGTQ